MKKHNKKTLAAIALIVASSNAFANKDSIEFSYMDDEYPAFALLSLSENDQYKKIGSSEREQNLQLLSSLHKYLESTDNHNYEAAEKAILYTFTNLYPDFKGYWDYEFKYKGVKVLQKDSLIDLEAVNYFDKPNYVNKHALKYGVSPVGIDGQKIKLCLLTQNKSSSWFEISQKDILAFESAMYENTENQLLCISEKHLSDYWKERLNQFYDYNYDYKVRYKYDRGY